MSFSLHTLAEERSLAYHRLVAEKVRQEPSLLEQARRRIAKWRERGTLSEFYALEWQRVLHGPLEGVLELLADPSERGRALRQTSPFAGVLDPRTRWRIHREVREQLLNA